MLFYYSKAYNGHEQGEKRHIKAEQKGKQNKNQKGQMTSKENDNRSKVKGTTQQTQ